MQRDLHNNLQILRSIAPVAVGTTGTGQTGKVIDTAGYHGVEVVSSFGSVTATNATLTLTVLEGDVTGTLTAVAAGDLVGTQVAIAAAATRTSGVSKNVTHRVGYIGIKRYVRADIKSTVTAGTLIASNVVLGYPNNRPVAT